MKNPKPKKPHPLTVSAMQNHVHLHSIVIARRRSLLEFERDQTEASIAALTTALAEEKRRRSEIDAKIEGISTVLASRGA